MADLMELLDEYRRHPGVHEVILLGRDGLVVETRGERGEAEELLAARVPGLVERAAALGRSSEQGDFQTAVLEYADGVGIVIALPGELLLLLLLDPGVGFAPLLRQLRQERETLVSLL